VSAKTKIKIWRPKQVWQRKIGAPRGNRNAVKTGRYTQDKGELRRQLHVFRREVDALLKMVDARIAARKSGNPV
jgi:hypothetical protein